MNVTFLTNEDKQELQGQIDKVSHKETDEKFFDIDYDGIVSLKSQYRGANDNSGFPYATSDMGLNKEGSLIDELPKRVVIPETIGDTAVTGFQEGIFSNNHHVEEIVIPKYITTLPRLFAYKATNLTSVENTENIVNVGNAGFGYTSIKKAIFPKLQTLGSSVFSRCPFLEIANIGSITNIPNSSFMGCNSLSALFGGENVTTVSKQAFMNTRRLKNLSFVGNITSIGDYAFIGSRVNLDNLPSNCTFSVNTPTYKQYGSADYTNGVTYSACENAVGTLFNQRNPLWADETIMNLSSTYKDGCSTIVGAEIYSALEGVKLDSPKDFEDVLRAIDTNLLNKDMGYMGSAKEVYEALGYEVTHYDELDATKLQDVYNKLSQGALLHKSIATNTAIDGGHAVMVYGVNQIGELLVADSDTQVNEVRVYENFKYSMPIHMLGTYKCDILIVKKP